MDRYEVRFSGAGGQGLILAGKILAEAAAIFDGRNAVQTQSYGPEARGGASKSEVVISDQNIEYPKAMSLDVLLSLTQESCNRYIGDLKKDGILIVDSDKVKEIPDGSFKLYSAPISKIAAEQVGKLVVTNIVALGIFIEISKSATKESTMEAIKSKVPKGTEELNLKAFEKGIEEGRKLLDE